MSKQVKEFNYNPPLIPFLDVLMRDHNLIALNKPLVFLDDWKSIMTVPYRASAVFAPLPLQFIA